MFFFGFFLVFARDGFKTGIPELLLHLLGLRDLLLCLNSESVLHLHLFLHGIGSSIASIGTSLLSFGVNRGEGRQTSKRIALRSTSLRGKCLLFLSGCLQLDLVDLVLLLSGIVLGLQLLLKHVAPDFFIRVLSLLRFPRLL